MKMSLKVKIKSILKTNYTAKLKFKFQKKKKTILKKVFGVTRDYMNQEKE